MEEYGIVVTLKNGETLIVPKERLTEDSPKFRYLIEELSFKEIDIDDFSPEAVNLFLTFLEHHELGEIEDTMFRALHKLSVVFEVQWLKESCRGWLQGKIDSATHIEQKKFIFDESWYIFAKWGEKCMVDRLISALAFKDNSTLISKYFMDVDDQLKTGQIDILLKLGGSNIDLFFRIILQILVGQRGLNGNVKYLLQKMNLALGSERNEELSIEVFDTISNLPEISYPDLQLTNQLITATWRLVSSRKKTIRRRTTTVTDAKKGADQVKSVMTLNDITKAVTEESITSMFWVVELLLYVYHKNTPNREDTQAFLTALENICSNKKLQKVSRQFLNIILTALNYSNLSQSDQIIYLLKEINNNDTLSTFHENVIIIKHDGFITVKTSTESKHAFMFKHPGSGTCEASNCGFILRVEKLDVDGLWTHTLCTNDVDYANTGIHLHDIISADEMYRYSVRSGNTPDSTKVTVAGGWNWNRKWFPDITDWKIEQGCVAYNVTDYLVTKPQCH